jgi:hypothetical protein
MGYVQRKGAALSMDILLSLDMADVSSTQVSSRFNHFKVGCNLCLLDVLFDISGTSMSAENDEASINEQRLPANPES